MLPFWQQLQAPGTIELIPNEKYDWETFKISFLDSIYFGIFLVQLFFANFSQKKFSIHDEVDKDTTMESTIDKMINDHRNSFLASKNIFSSNRTENIQIIDFRHSLSVNNFYRNFTSPFYNYFIELYVLWSYISYVLFLVQFSSCILNFFWEKFAENNWPNSNQKNSKIYRVQKRDFESLSIIVFIGY